VAKRLWVPTGWEPVDREKTVVLPGGQEYFERLTRTVAGEKLVAILIAPTSPGDPSAFYMLENKITNQVFATEWDRADKNPSSALNQLRRRAGDQGSVLLPEEWRKGAIDPEKTTEDKVAYRGITGEMAGVPVVAVTFPEAMMVADALGGLVPTKKQWIKATGASEGNGDGPAGPAEDENDGVADIRRRQLALAQSAPWPVARRTNDVSVFGIHQLVSNGYEWTRDTAGGLPLDQIEETRLTPTMSIVSNGWEMKRILTYKRILESTPGAEWTRTGQMAGFRIVLEPK
jgi:formylglycine-generating enzyme required for sulfatase activity